MRSLALLIMVGCVACAGDEAKSPCDTDDACAASEVCSIVEYCVEANLVRAVTVRWTIDGVAPTPTAPGACTSIASFTVGFSDGPDTGIVEVDCAKGEARFDDVPRTVEGATVATYSASGDTRSVETRTFGRGNEIVVEFDVRLTFPR